MTLLKKRFYLVLIAGLAGGLAEVLWIAMYSAVTHTAGLEVSRQVTAAVIPVAAEWSVAPVLGVAIHLVLSVALAFLCCALFIEPLARRFGRGSIILASTAILAGVWAINFLVVLPVISPAFVSLMPFLVTLTSKMLFGLAMGAVLTRGLVATAARPAN